MWSEHCSYKNTRPLLKTFPTKSPKILVGGVFYRAGGAGVVGTGESSGGVYSARRRAEGKYLHHQELA